VIGSDAYAFCPEDYGKPVVIAGFEPLDVLQSILMLVRQVNEGRADIENQYVRAVTPEGQPRAPRPSCAEVFEVRDSFEWRGLGDIPRSALRHPRGLRGVRRGTAFRHGATRRAAGTKSCECPAMLRGQKKARGLQAVRHACTPETPLGSCMVSDEGACAAYYHYGRFREEASSAMRPARRSERSAGRCGRELRHEPREPGLRAPPAQRRRLDLGRVASI
jgi:hydrogenase expression/formation protein HypD